MTNPAPDHAALLAQAEAREAATRDILAAISGSREDAGPVFDAILDRACALCDAASAQVLMGCEKAKAMGLEPLALIRGYAFVGFEPKRFGIAPAKAWHRFR